MALRPGVLALKKRCPSNAAKTENGVTVFYIGGYYEWTAAGSTKYYYAGAQRIAMRREGYALNNGLFWLLSDHLGSTTAVIQELEDLPTYEQA